VTKLFICNSNRIQDLPSGSNDVNGKFRVSKQICENSFSCRMQILVNEYFLTFKQERASRLTVFGPSKTTTRNLLRRVIPLTTDVTTFVVSTPNSNSNSDQEEMRRDDE
jgi:hypothetical protein